jgi:hypothetical protein
MARGEEYVARMDVSVEWHVRKTPTGRKKSSFEVSTLGGWEAGGHRNMPTDARHPDYAEC